MKKLASILALIAVSAFGQGTVLEPVSNIFYLTVSGVDTNTGLSAALDITGRSNGMAVVYSGSGTYSHTNITTVETDPIWAAASDTYARVFTEAPTNVNFISATPVDGEIFYCVTNGNINTKDAPVDQSFLMYDSGLAGYVHRYTTRELVHSVDVNADRLSGALTNLYPGQLMYVDTGYYAGDVYVITNLLDFSSIATNDTGWLPNGTNDFWWDLFVEKGDTGARGVQGADGVGNLEYSIYNNFATNYVWSTGTPVVVSYGGRWYDLTNAPGGIDTALAAGTRPDLNPEYWVISVDKGDDGTITVYSNFVVRGEYDNAETYNTNDLVSYFGNEFVVWTTNQQPSAGTAPGINSVFIGTNTPYWTAWRLRGVQGRDGNATNITYQTFQFYEYLLFTNHVFTNTPSAETNLIQWVSEDAGGTNYFEFVTAADIGVVTESDPVWAAASNLYAREFQEVPSDTNYLSVVVDGVVSYCLTNGTGGSTVSGFNDLTNVNVTGASENDTVSYVGGIWTNVAAGSASVTNEVDPVWTNAQAAGFTMTGPLTINPTSTNALKISTAHTNIEIGAGAITDFGDFGSIAIGYYANAGLQGSAGESIAIGREARGTRNGIAIGNYAHAYLNSVAIGQSANGYNAGAVVGHGANGASSGAALGNIANGGASGVALGAAANGNSCGVSVGRDSNGSVYGVAVGYTAKGARTNIAIGVGAVSSAGSERIAMGHNVSNAVDNSAAIRGSLYLDGGTGVAVRATFGAGAWTWFQTDGTNLFFVNSTGGTEQVTGL